MNIVRTGAGIAVQTAGGPLLIRHIIGIGRNYAEHAREQAATVPTRPMVFVKAPASACLSGEAIVIPAVCRDPRYGGDQVDFEAELAVVIGTGGRNIAEDRALSHVLGYCCANDVSARWWQKEGSGGQFCRGKSFDTFCPLGPRLVPAAEVRDPQAMRVRCRVNGGTMQDDSTAGMIFPVSRLVSELSWGTTLLPGTVILTGTPSGVGMARTPPVWLREGDTVEVEIDGLGVLSNPVRCEA
ncbi:MAG: fumarylacetoacetate hydrolase family protein [Phycisphaerales bacterium]|nr:fumarylacetoacetate hydrolase family protein [Phycisphaerales bacterium]